VPGKDSPKLRDALISPKSPEYPELARVMGIGATIIIKVTVASDGSIKHIEFLRAHPLFTSAILEAVQNWHFDPKHPAVHDGRRTVFKLVFQLE